MIIEVSQLWGEKDSENAGTIFKGNILFTSKPKQNKTKTTKTNILHQKISLTAQTVRVGNSRYWQAPHFLCRGPKNSKLADFIHKQDKGCLSPFGLL